MVEGIPSSVARKTRGAAEDFTEDANARKAKDSID